MDLCRAAAEEIKFKGVEDEEKIDDDSIGFGDDLWYEILSKIPLKPLMISKCVCKSWHQLASKIIIQSIPKNPLSGFFIASFIPCISSSESFHYLPIERRDDDDDDDEKKMSCKNHYDSLTSLPSHPRTHILDSRDGFLLCCTYCRQREYFLYNPVTRQYVPLPTPPIPMVGTAVDATAKLVFDDSSDSYRVIRIAIGRGGIHADDWALADAKFDTPHMSVHIYSSETGKWVVSKELELPWYYFPSYSVFLDGGIYLLACSSKDDCKIFRFDVNDESSGFVWSPPGSMLMLSNCLGVCEGRLCYAQHLEKDHGHRLEVWEFDDEKEWVLKYRFKDSRAWDFNVVTFHPYLNALFVRSLDGFHWLDLETGKLKGTMSCSPPVRSAERYSMVNCNFKAYPFYECYIHRRL